MFQANKSEPGSKQFEKGFGPFFCVYIFILFLGNLRRYIFLIQVYTKNIFEWLKLAKKKQISDVCLGRVLRIYQGKFDQVERDGGIGEYSPRHTNEKFSRIFRNSRKTDSIRIEVVQFTFFDCILSFHTGILSFHAGILFFYDGILSSCYRYPRRAEEGAPISPIFTTEPHTTQVATLTPSNSLSFSKLSKISHWIFYEYIFVMIYEI